MGARKLLPIFVFSLLTLLVFYQYFLNHKLPIPGDILIGHYHPWADSLWDGRQTIYPIKNWHFFDGIRQTLPWRLLAIRQIKEGIGPFWNRYSFAGTPLLGNWQTGVLYPLNLLFVFLPELDAWSVYIILQPFLAGLFLFYFLKDLVKKKLPAFFGAIAWGLSLVMINHWEYGIDGHTMLWLPLSLWAINRLSQKITFWGSFCLLLATLSTLLAGYPPLAVYCLGLVFIYSIFKVRPVLSAKMFFIFGLVGLGIVISLPQIAPSLDLIAESSSGVAAGVLDQEYFLPIGNLIMTFAPDFFGHQVTRNSFSKTYYSDSPAIGAAGLVFFVFAVCLLFFKKNKQRREMFFWFLVATIPILLMLENPFSVFFASLPVNLIASVSPIKMTWLVSLSLSILATLAMVQLEKLLANKKFLILLLPPFVLVAFFWFLSLLIPENAVDRLVSQRNLLIPSFVALATLFLLLFSFKFNRFYKWA
ncbi:MAG: hypothetical protein ABID04_01380, partial [Patescibacteria group bacterium]